MARKTTAQWQPPGAHPFIQGYWAASEAWHLGHALERPTGLGRDHRFWQREWQRGVDAFHAWLETPIGRMRAAKMNEKRVMREAA